MMNEKKDDESKEKPKNPFEEMQRQLQEMFGNANINVVPTGFGFHQPGEPEDKAPEPPPPVEESDPLDLIRKFFLKPRDIKDDLDRFVIRQDEAKRAMAVAVCDHYNHVRRCLENPELAERPYMKQNVLLLGPTGVGKTYLLRTLARLIGVPFVKADATKFSETGYVGHDVEDMVRDLVRTADNDVELAKYGIIYIDEIDKIAASGGQGKDVSGKGVQTNLLKLMEETDVNLVSQSDMMGQMQAMMEMQRGGKAPTRTMSTRHILFIVSGAFTGMNEIIRKRMKTNVIGFSSVAGTEELDEDRLLHAATTRDFVDYGYEPEFIGRLPVRVAFDSLKAQDLLAILEQAEDNILSKYIEDFKGYGIELKVDTQALGEIAERAEAEKTGARGLMTVLEGLLREYKYELPSTAVKELVLTPNMVKNPAADLQALLADNEHAQRDIHLQEIEAFVLRFEEQHGLKLKFHKKAAEAVAKEAEKSGRTVHTVCERLFKDYPYGLKLLQNQTGKKVFSITPAMVKNPDKALSELIMKQYQAGEDASQDA
ncbi:AAA family ATPase [Kiritimatiellota bacterium B12222]|nr:AAA family ATPase [Kiritimatiellota bacterium B12222]